MTNDELIRKQQHHIWDTFCATPNPAGNIEVPTGDVNSTAPHQDVIREKFKLIATDVNASKEERAQAIALLEMLWREVHD